MRGGVSWVWEVEELLGRQIIGRDLPPNVQLS